MEELEEALARAYKVTYLASNQALIWDKQDKQIPELQKLFKPNKPNRKLLLRVAESCVEHTIGVWPEWSQCVTKEDFVSLLHLDCE